MNSVVMSPVAMFPSSVESLEFVGHASDFHVLKNNFFLTITVYGVFITILLLMCITS